MAQCVEPLQLKHQRDERGLSLTDVSKRSGLDRALLSRLENGKVLNPKMATLWRYADAIGARVSLAVEPLPAGADS
jgi:transcriptional regulator with XRE-family HTH domain